VLSYKLYYIKASVNTLWHGIYVHLEQIGDFVISSSKSLKSFTSRYTTECLEGPNVQQMFEHERLHCIILSCSLERMKGYMAGAHYRLLYREVLCFHASVSEQFYCKALHAQDVYCMRPLCAQRPHACSKHASWA